jgi:hypothetical protein
MKKENSILDICKIIGCSGLNKDCLRGNTNCEIIQKIINNEKNRNCITC